MTGITFPSTAEWLAERQKNVGGSEIAALFGCQPAYAMSKYTLWHVKAGKIPAPEGYGERPKWGLRLEAAIAEGAAERNGWEIEKGWYVKHPKIGGMACSLDYVAQGAVTNGPGVVEVKNVDWLQHKTKWGDEPPPHIHLQVQHELACTGYQWAASVALIGGNQLAEPYYIEPRPKIIAEIERRVTDFWTSIRADQPPPVDDSASTAAALAALFPAPEPGKAYELAGEEDLSIWADLRQAQLDGKAAEAQERAARNKLIAKLQDAELITRDGAVVGTYKQQTRKEHMVKASTFRVLRIKGE